MAFIVKAILFAALIVAITAQFTVPPIPELPTGVPAGAPEVPAIPPTPEVPATPELPVLPGAPEVPTGEVPTGEVPAGEVPAGEAPAAEQTNAIHNGFNRVTNSLDRIGGRRH